MRFSDEKIKTYYQQMDLDPQQKLQTKIHEQICAKKDSFKRKTVWGLSAACVVAALVMLAVWFSAPDTPYWPDPQEMDRMNFAFYRELALPGQDLGISYDDFPPTVQL